MMMMIVMEIPIVVTLVGIVTDAKSREYVNAPLAIVVTLVGMMILVVVQYAYW